MVSFGDRESPTRLKYKDSFVKQGDVSSVGRAGDPCTVPTWGPLILFPVISETNKNISEKDNIFFQKMLIISV